ncbi:MAG TPA: hypothetical protein VF535_11835 [Allosphingosinicella sp.]
MSDGDSPVGPEGDGPSDEVSAGKVWAMSELMRPRAEPRVRRL